MSADTLLAANSLRFHHHDHAILNSASLALAAHDRIGLVGPNGGGKSTTMRLLAGELTPDSGEITRRKDVVVGYLPQTFELDPLKSVYQSVREGAAKTLELIHEFENLPGHDRRHEELEQHIERLGGWTLDARIRSALNQLGCPADDRLIRDLSGGEHRRVALARALVAQPDVLMLDEPTNHLDIESVSWITDFLGSYPGALLVVTHDRHFLDEVANLIVELRNGVFERYEGNYSDYLAARAEKLAAEELVEHKRQMFLRKELEWVRRRPKAQTSKSKARLDQFFAVQEAVPAAVLSEMELVVPPPPQLGNRVVELDSVGITLGGKRLFSNLNLSFAGGTRIGITGRNGLGKTTLLKLILGQLDPTEGEVRVGQLTKFNYVDQGRLQLAENRTVLEEMSDGSEWVAWGDSRLSVRAYLKRFLFTDDGLSTQIRHLSGGERSRLLLAKVLKKGGNFLILDEPTNDLDLQTMRVLEEALVEFSGCVLVVSHDRYFLNRVCTGILSFEGEGRLVFSEGNYDYYLEKKRRSAPKPQESPKLKAPAAKPAIPAAPKARKLSFKELRELEGMEAAIQTAEAEVVRLEALFADPDFHRTHGTRTNELLAELEAAKTNVSRFYTRWEELESIRAAAAA